MKEYKGLCPDCEEEKIYSKTLTDGLCLNCYTRRQEENYLTYIDAKIDYEEGYY